MNDKTLSAITYLTTLIQGQETSSISVQLSELTTLKALMEREQFQRDFYGLPTKADKIATINVFHDPNSGDITAQSIVALTNNQSIHDTITTAADALCVELQDLQG